MWNRDEVRGKTDQVKGRVKEEVGDMMDDDRLENEGRSERAAGEIQEGFGRGRRKIGNAIKDVGHKIGR